MRTLTKKDASKAEEIDANVKNRFKFSWLDMSAGIDINNKTREYKLADCFEKVDVGGKVMCTWCGDLVNYGKRGKTALLDHAKSAKHKKKGKVCLTNYTFTASKPMEASSHSSMFSAPSTSSQQETAEPRVSIHDRVTNMEALVLGVIAEKSLPFTMAPVIIDVAKSLAKDQKALNHLTMDRTSASYKMRLGLAETFHNQTVSMMQTQKFSLNIDEATSNNLNRVLAILVSYFDYGLQNVVVQHFSSISVINVTAKALFDELDDLFKKNKIPWSNLMSILMDSCAVMRGKKSGLETRIRNEKAPQLLDIDGDICHHIHNASKKLCQPFDYWAEGLFSVIYSDFKWSTDLREVLQSLCLYLEVKFTAPDRFISHRWLSCYDVAVSTLRLWSVFTVFYYGFLSKSDKVLYHGVVEGIYKEKGLSSSVREQIKLLHQQLQTKKLTTDGQKRKDEAILKIFYQRKKTRLIMHFYRAVLPVLKKYVCLFESKTPLIHKLHDEQLKLFKNFLALFLKPEAFTGKSPKELKNPQKVLLTESHLSQKDVFVGSASTIIKESKKTDSVIATFLDTAEKAYQTCAQYLQQKLPLDNLLMKCLSATDPCARGHSTTLAYMLKLPKLVTNVLNQDEEEQYDLDCRQYQVDASLPPFEGEHGEEVPLDKWWAGVMVSESYPALCKMMRALLSCFHGPAVEGSFNIMGDIVDPKSASINIQTYSAIQTVKYGLRARGTTSVQAFHRKDILHSPVDVPMCNNIRSSRRRYSEELEKKRQALEDKKQKLSLSSDKLQSKRKAKAVIDLAEKKARNAHRRAMLSKMVKNKLDKRT